MAETGRAADKTAASAITTPAVETIALSEAPPEALMDDNIIASIAESSNLNIETLSGEELKSAAIIAYAFTDGQASHLLTLLAALFAGTIAYDDHARTKPDHHS